MEGSGERVSTFGPPDPDEKPGVGDPGSEQVPLQAASAGASLVPDAVGETLPERPWEGPALLSPLGSSRPTLRPPLPLHCPLPAQGLQVVAPAGGAHVAAAAPLLFRVIRSLGFAFRAPPLPCRVSGSESTRPTRHLPEASAAALALGASARVEPLCASTSAVLLHTGSSTQCRRGRAGLTLAKLLTETWPRWAPWGGRGVEAPQLVRGQVVCPSQSRPLHLPPLGEARWGPREEEGAGGRGPPADRRAHAHAWGQVVYEESRMVRLTTPYVSGFLAFREAPFLVDAVQRLREKQPDLMPQVLLVDGNGVLHHQGFGVACHLGVLTDLPCIGVAKKLLQVDGLEKDAAHKEQIQLLQAGEAFPLIGGSGTVLGMALRSHDRSTKPVYVSVGHKVSLETAVRLTRCCCRFRVPEPVRQADIRSREHIRRTLGPPGMPAPAQGSVTAQRPQADPTGSAGEPAGEDGALRTSVAAPAQT